MFIWNDVQQSTTRQINRIDSLQMSFKARVKAIKTDSALGGRMHDSNKRTPDFTQETGLCPMSDGHFAALFDFIG